MQVLFAFVPEPPQRIDALLQQIDEADQIRICALANPTLCLDQKFLVTDSGELAYDHANFREGVFALELENRPGLCLSRKNMSTPMACNVMDLNQRCRSRPSPLRCTGAD
jgi:hypothetical protein